MGCSASSSAALGQGDVINKKDSGPGMEKHSKKEKNAASRSNRVSVYSKGKGSDMPNINTAIRLSTKTPKEQVPPERPSLTEGPSTAVKGSLNTNDGVSGKLVGDSKVSSPYSKDLTKELPVNRPLVTVRTVKTIEIQRKSNVITRVLDNDRIIREESTESKLSTPLANECLSQDQSPPTKHSSAKSSPVKRASAKVSPIETTLDKISPSQKSQGSLNNAHEPGVAKTVDEDVDQSPAKVPASDAEERSAPSVVLRRQDSIEAVAPENDHGTNVDAESIITLEPILVATASTKDSMNTSDENKVEEVGSLGGVTVDAETAALSPPLSMNIEASPSVVVNDGRTRPQSGKHHRHHAQGHHQQHLHRHHSRTSIAPTAVKTGASPDKTIRITSQDERTQFVFKTIKSRDEGEGAPGDTRDILIQTDVISLNDNNEKTKKKLLIKMTKTGSKGHEGSTTSIRVSRPKQTSEKKQKEEKVQPKEKERQKEQERETDKQKELEVSGATESGRTFIFTHDMHLDA